MLNSSNILKLHSMKERVLFEVGLILFVFQTNTKAFLICETLKMGMYSRKIFLLTFCKKKIELLLIYRLSVNIYSKLYFVCEKV